MINERDSKRGIIDIEEPTIIGVWIFLNSGHCLFRYNRIVEKGDEGEKGQEQMVAGLLSSMDLLFSEMLGDRCNVVFGYHHAYYYNYLGLLTNNKGSSSSLICVIATKLKGKFSLSDMLSYEKLSIKSGQILISFFTKYTDQIMEFKGNLEQFRDFKTECKEIINGMLFV